MNNNSNRCISASELRRLQLDILDSVHCFCINNRINYSLSSGTLIGAIRHKGFIPWDDDIDICMLRSDYERFEALFPDLLDGKFEFKSLCRDSQWNKPWGKIQDSRTVMYETFNDDYLNHGVGIDVFPMDDVPEDGGAFLVWNTKRKVLVYSWMIKGMKFDPQRSFWKTIVMLCEKALLFPFNLRQIASIIDKYIQRPNGKGYRKVFESCDSLRARISQDKADFDFFIDIEFEGKCFKSMAGYDDYLRSIYGDYMTLPPENERVTHHSFSAFWKENHGF